MINLTNCTLIAVDCKQPEMAVKALEATCSKMKFSQVILFSNTKPFNFNNNFVFKEISKLNNLGEYSKFMMNILPDYIETEFCFNIQHDGYVVRYDLWDDRFLDYDYIGAPWRSNAHFLPQGVRVGNGGVSIRSKRLLDFCKNLSCDSHEDTEICARYRNVLEANGCKFAPLDIASKFAVEQFCDDLKLKAGDSFAFHGIHSLEHKQYIKKLILDFYKDDLIKMDKGRLIDWIRNEAGSQIPSYFYCNSSGNLQLQQVPEEYAELLLLFKNSNIESYLELGVANGGSFFVNSIFLQNTAKKLYCVDNLAYKETHVQQTESKILSKVNKLKDMFFDKTFKFYNSTTDDYFKTSQDYFDCIFIDADHSYEGVKRDFENALNHVNENGILVFHDIANVETGVKKLWNEIKDNFKDNKEFCFTEANWYNCGIGVLYI
jgi:predicted O-methyltransferase YrrM